MAHVVEGCHGLGAVRGAESAADGRHGPGRSSGESLPAAFPHMETSIGVSEPQPEKTHPPVVPRGTTQAGEETHSRVRNHGSGKSAHGQEASGGVLTHPAEHLGRPESATVGFPSLASGWDR